MYMAETILKAGSRILVVDDDADARVPLVDILELNGYSAASAGNGREAIEYLQTSALPALVILDLQMPVMDGRSFHAAQKTHPALAAVPAVVVTALAGEGVDANEVLLKPIDIDRFLTIVSHYVGVEQTA